MWFGSGDRRQLIGGESNECRSTGVFGSLRFRRSPEEQPPPAYPSEENYKANGENLRDDNPSKPLGVNKRGDTRKYGKAETAMSSELLLPRHNADEVRHHAGKEVMHTHQCQFVEKVGHVRDNHLGQQELLFAPKASRACTPTGSMNHDRDCLLKKSRWRKSKKSHNESPVHHNNCGSCGLNNPSFDDS